MEYNKMKDTAQYYFKGGFTMRREYGLTPNGNKMNGMWVVRDCSGSYVDHDQYRNDLIERNKLKPMPEEVEC